MNAPIECPCAGEGPDVCVASSNDLDNEGIIAATGGLHYCRKLHEQGPSLDSVLDNICSTKGCGDVVAAGSDRCNACKQKSRKKNPKELADSTKRNKIQEARGIAKGQLKEAYALDSSFVAFSYNDPKKKNRTYWIPYIKNDTDPVWVAQSNDSFRARLTSELSILVRNAYDGETRLPLSPGTVGEVEGLIYDENFPKGLDIARIEDPMTTKPFNLRTGEILNGVMFEDYRITLEKDGAITRTPLRSSDFITHCIPGKAPSIPVLTPSWEHYCRTSLNGDLDQFRLLNELMGMALMRDVGQQKVILLIGKGRSGKGVVQRLLVRMIGDQSVISQSDPTRLAGTFSLGSGVGKSLLLIPDCPQAPHKGSPQFASFSAGMAVLKQISGQDFMPVERKYQDAEFRQLELTCMVTTNNDVDWVRGTRESDSWRGRLMPVLFEASIEEDVRSSEFEKNLNDEIVDIAYYAISCYAAAVGRGDKNASFTETSQKDRVLAQMRTGALDAKEQFIERFVRQGDEEDSIFYSDIKQAWEKHFGYEIKPNQLGKLVTTIEGTFEEVHRGKSRHKGKPAACVWGVYMDENEEGGKVLDASFEFGANT